MRRTSILVALAASVSQISCATGFGEAATGAVSVFITPVSTASSGLTIEAASLTLRSFALTPVEPDPGGGDDHGHSHSHLVLDGAGFASALPADAAPGALVTVDLLGDEQLVRRDFVPATSFTGISLSTAAADDGEASGCALFARATAELADDLVPVLLCLEGVDEELADIHVHLDVGLDEEVPLHLTFSLGSLFRAVDLSSLPRESDGSIRIDDRRQPAAAAVIRANLSTAMADLEGDH